MSPASGSFWGCRSTAGHWPCKPDIWVRIPSLPPFRNVKSFKAGTRARPLRTRVLRTRDAGNQSSLHDLSARSSVGCSVGLRHRRSRVRVPPGRPNFVVDISCPQSANVSTSFLDGLVRVVARDGSVWWVTPASAPWYRALESARCGRTDALRPASNRDGGGSNPSGETITAP